MKKIALIPALLNSSRVPNKNLLLVDGFPLMYYVINSCKESGIFDEIYVSSDDLIFKPIAEQLGAKFYHRKKENGGSSCTMKNSSRDCQGTRCSVHDHYLYDFMTSEECSESDYIVQVHTTSPLLEPSTIRNFTISLINSFDSLVTVDETYSESFVNDEPVNFKLHKKQPTQSLDPVQSISWALTGWNKEKFISEYETGPTFCGDFGTYPISKIEGIDVDTMDELYIAEACLSHRKRKDNVGKWYYNESITSIERELKDLINLDGSPIPNDDVLGHNETLMSLKDIEEKIGNDDTWCYPVVFTDNDQIAFIHQRKGEGCRKHYHPTKDEWWVIFRGTFEYQLWYNTESPLGDPDEVIIAGKEDLVFLKKGTVHVITCISDEPGTRLACGEKNMAHVYVK